MRNNLAQADVICFLVSLFYCPVLQQLCLCVLFKDCLYFPVCFGSYSVVIDVVHMKNSRRHFIVSNYRLS